MEIIHESLSVDCIYLRMDGQILVANPGLVSLLEPNHEGELRDLKIILGEGSAPEQLLGKPIGPFTDVYALAAVLYHLLTGSPVFSGRTPEEIAQQHLYASIPSLNQWRSDLPAGLYSIFARAMSKSPAQRFYQPGAFANAYHRIVDPHNRTHVPFVVSGSSSIQPREVTPLPGEVQITELTQGNNGIIRTTRTKAASEVLLQTPFPAIPSSFSASTLLDQRSSRNMTSQHRLGRRQMRLMTVSAILVLLILVVGSTIGITLLAHRSAVGSRSFLEKSHFLIARTNLPGRLISFRINLQGLNAPQSGFHYEAWLINNDTEQVTPLGTLGSSGKTYTLPYSGNRYSTTAGRKFAFAGR